jgi:hypothetical protein
LNSGDQVSFTINLAIASKRVLAYEGRPTDIPPAFNTAHWEERIGYFLSGQKDKWWTLTDVSSLGIVESEVRHALVELAVPKLLGGSSEQGLCELLGIVTFRPWEYRQLKIRSILLAQGRRFDELPKVFQRMRELALGRPWQSLAEGDIDEIKKRFSLPMEAGSPKSEAVVEPTLANRID